jgi:hypothetical protein
MRARNLLLRLTVDAKSGEVLINLNARGRTAIQGRSCYFCANKQCCETALKHPKLKAMLQGGRGLKDRPRRSVHWPLEPRLIETLISKCTEKPGIVPQ